MAHNATPIGGTGGTVPGTNVGAGGGPCEGGEHGVWFRWHAPMTGTLRLLARSSDTKYVGALKDLLCVPPHGRGPERSLEVMVIGGETLWIRITGEETPFELDYRLIPAAKPAIDDFVHAEILVDAAGTKRVTNAGATREPSEPLHAGQPGGRSVWFSWTAPSSGRAVFTTAPAELDTLLAVYTGDAVSSLSRVVSNDDVSADGSSRVEFVARAGETYRIAVDGAGGAEGSIWRDNTGYERAISLTWNSGPPPPNDDFDAAVVLEAPETIIKVPIPAVGWTTGASSEPGEPNHTAGTGSSSVWFRWTAEESGDVGITLHQIEHRTLRKTLRVYTGADVSRLTLVPGSYHPWETPQADWHARAGTTYHIALDGGLDATGPYILDLHEPTILRNDDFADAARLEGAFGAYSGTESGATAEPGEPSHAGWRAISSVWFEWTAPVSGPVTFDTLGSRPRALAVYTGRSLASLQEVVATEMNDWVTFDAVAGTTYRIVVDDNDRMPFNGVSLVWRPGTTPDQTPPTGRVTSPAPGQDVSGFVTMTVDAEDNLAVQRAVPYGYAGWTGWPDTEAPYVFRVDSTLWPDGYGIGLRVDILDMGLNTTRTEKLWVRNENFPPAAFFEGPEGAVASTTARVYARFGGYETIVARFCSLDGGPFLPCDHEDGIVYENLAQGDHVVRTHVVDHAGKRSPTPGTGVWTVDTRPVAPGPPQPDSTPPVTSEPFPRAATAVQAGARTAPVRLTFQASDAGGSVGRYEVEQRAGSAAWRRVWSGSASSVTRQLAPGAYRHRVRAVDRAGNVGAWAESALRVRAIQETGLRFGGAWTRARSVTAHGGALRHSARAGAWARASFSGSSVAFVSALGPARGKADIWVDSVRVRTIDLYSARSQMRRVVFQHDFDKPGPHVVKVRVHGTKNPRSTGRRVDVDAFVVLD